MVDAAAGRVRRASRTSGRIVREDQVGVLGPLVAPSRGRRARPAGPDRGAVVPGGRSRVWRSQVGDLRVARGPPPPSTCVLVVRRAQVELRATPRDCASRSTNCSCWRPAKSSTHARPVRRGSTRTAPARRRLASASASTTALCATSSARRPGGRSSATSPTAAAIPSTLDSCTSRVVDPRRSSGTPASPVPRRRRSSRRQRADGACSGISQLWRRREDFLAGRRSSSSSSLPPLIAFFTPLMAPLVFFEAPPSCRSPTASVRSLPPCS